MNNIVSSLPHLEYLLARKLSTLSEEKLHLIESLLETLERQDSPPPDQNSAETDS